MNATVLPETVSAIPAPQHREYYVKAMQHLVQVVQDLSQAHDVDSVTAIVRRAARDLTGADGATFVLRDGDLCYYADEDAIAPLWKGHRFPMETCISGWVMLNAQSTVIEDIYQDPRIPAAAYRPTFVKSLAMVPIRRDAPIGAIGNYWASQRLPTEEEVAILQALADTTSVALENVQLYSDLKEKIRRLQVQEIRIQTQHDALDVFTRALAHDLREPVRALTSYSDLIGSADVTAEEAARYFMSIRTASRRMAMLIESVFQYTQIDAGEHTAKVLCAMDEVLDGVKASLHQDGPRMPTIQQSPLPQVSANPSQMEQVFGNLISNAVRHGGQAVTISVEAEERDDTWLFTVRDNGPGIAAEQVDKIFHPFKRLVNREDCAGLGLAICKKIVEAHRGRIWCESDIGNGATFRFELPKGEGVEQVLSTVLPVAAPVAAASHTVRPANVLLVDDREDDITVAKMALMRRAKLHFNLKVAHDGREALNLLRDLREKGQPVDLTLLDINMPDMDGFEFLEHVRKDESTRDMPVVMCTGSTYSKDVNRAQTLGVAGYLVKPASFARLKPIIEQIPALRLDQEGEGYKLLKAA